MYKSLVYKFSFIYIFMCIILFFVIFLNYDNSDNIFTLQLNHIIIFYVFILIFLALIFYSLVSQKIANMKLKKINDDLDRKIELEIKKNRKKDLSLLNQSKMTSLSQMLNNIAHQWRQPLNVITTSSSGLMIHKQMNSLDDKTFNLLTESISEQANYLSNTIENFTEHLKQHENIKEEIILQDKIEKALQIVNKSFEYENIKIYKEYEKQPIFIHVNSSDFTQVLLNILNNAKDALVKNCDKDNRKIIIDIKKRKEKVIICIEDIAGGIPTEIVDKIFDPYFTTKHESVGTGISLYSCYEIITKQEKGKLYFKNTQKGAKFCIEISVKL